MICVFDLERPWLSNVAASFPQLCGRMEATIISMCMCVFVWKCANPHLRHSSNPKSRPGIFHLLWCSDTCVMALNCEFSSASRAAGLSNSKIWKWKIEHRSLPAYKSAPVSLCTENIRSSWVHIYKTSELFPLRRKLSRQNSRYEWLQLQIYAKRWKHPQKLTFLSGRPD